MQKFHYTSDSTDIQGIHTKADKNCPFYANRCSEIYGGRMFGKVFRLFFVIMQGFHPSHASGKSLYIDNLGMILFEQICVMTMCYTQR